MSEVQNAADQAIQTISQLVRQLKKRASKQISVESEKKLIRQVCVDWFKVYREPLVLVLGDNNVNHIDTLHQAILEATTKSSLRRWYIAEFLRITKELNLLLAAHPIAIAKGTRAHSSKDEAPSFRKLVSDASMQDILKNRWTECVICVNSGACLSSIVMMGGLLEALLLAKVNQSDKSIVFKCKSAPKDRATQKTKQLTEWTLRNYIDVAFEMKWISHSAQSVGEVLRDYRNFIHPYKELTTGFKATPADATMNWTITKALVSELVS